MAYLLYKYIQKKRKEGRKGKAESQDVGFETLDQPQESPAQIQARSGSWTTDLQNDGGTELKAAAPLGNNSADTNINENIGSNIESTNHDEKSKKEDTRTKREKKAARMYRLKLISGLFLPFSVQALETTIIAGALPFIASDFNQLGQLNWIVSAFNLCAATFIPMWGQLANIFGRYAALQSALAIMIIGSTLCAGSPVTAFPMLLVGRALQGMGCAGCNVLVRTCLADKVSLQENAKNNTIFTMVAGIAYGIGPVVGGYLTEVTWRWCFIINCPIGVAGIVLAHFVLRPELLGPQSITRTDGVLEPESTEHTFRRRLSTIDFGGQFFFLFGMGLFILAMTWGGSYYPWDHVNVLAPLIIGVLLVLAFFTWEHLMRPGNALALRFPYQKPMIPLNILFTRNAGIIAYINFITGMAMYAAFYFADLYFTLVLQFTSSKAGTNIIYYLPGLGVGAYSAIFLCNVWPRQTWHPLFIGTILEPLGITLLALALSLQNTSFIYGMLALAGLGTGIRFMPGTLHGVGYFPDHIASIVSLMLLAVSLGGAFSTTIMLNIFNNRMKSYGLSFEGSGQSFGAIDSLSAEQQGFLRGKAKDSIALAFWAVSAFLWLGCVLMGGLGNVSIGVERGDGEEPMNVIKGTYLGSLVRRRKTNKV